jgi:hypothetical protein
MKRLVLAGVLAAMAVAGGAAHASPFTDVVQAPTGYFVPTDAQKYDSPYYRGYGEDWSWTHDPIAGSFSSATLNISAFDVDSPYEVDEIYAYDNGNPVLLGSLTGLNDTWVYSNTFNLGSNFFDDIAAGLKVSIHIDSFDDGWIVTLGKSALSVDDGGLPPPIPGGGGVPEPATWAMMILGFFGLGASVRRRREALA